jgi:hypothetical protein
MVVEPAGGDIAHDLVMLFYQQPGHLSLKVGVVQELRIECLTGKDELPAVINQRFDILGLKALVLGLNEEG